MMDTPRHLQHASLALEKNDSATESLFPYMIAVVFAIFAIYLGLRFSYLWMCRVVCGRVPPPKPLNGEDILANMTEEERKAIFQTVVKKLCKTATDSDISKPRKQTKDQEEEKKDTDEAPIADLEILSSHTRETADLDASEKPPSNDGSGELPPPLTMDEKTDLPSSSQDEEGDVEAQLDASTDAVDSSMDDADPKNKSATSSDDTAHSEPAQEEPRSPDIEEDNGSVEATNEEDKDPSLEGSRSQQEDDLEAQDGATKDQQSSGIEAGPSSSTDTSDPATESEPSQECRPFDIEEGCDCHCALDAGVGVESKDQQHSSTFLPSPMMLSPPPHSSRRSMFSQPSVDGSAMVGHDVCSICLGDYQLGNMLFVSKHCGHIFHVDCILEWLDKHEECPICRVKMVTQEEMVEAAVEFVQKSTATEDAAEPQQDSA